jgi:hypothetical protein
MTLYGYARVSTRDQDLAGQVAELMAAGCVSVFREKVSGAKSDRAELARVLARLGADDVLVVSRLDRLARSTRDLLNVIDAVSIQLPQYLSKVLSLFPAFPSPLSSLQGPLCGFRVPKSALPVRRHSCLPSLPVIHGISFLFRCHHRQNPLNRLGG